jgi:hypothetical protein
MQPIPGFGRRVRTSFAVAQDGRTLFTGAQDGRVAAYDLETGNERFAIKALAKENEEYTYPVADMTVTPDGRMLLAVKPSVVAAFDANSGAEDWLFDPLTGQASYPFECPNPVETMRHIDGLTMSPNGYQLAVIEFGDSAICDSITVYETASGAIRKQLLGHRNVINDIAPQAPVRTFPLESFFPDLLKILIDSPHRSLGWHKSCPTLARRASRVNGLVKKCRLRSNSLPACRMSSTRPD